MNEKTLLMKVVDHIKKETSWNEFICSLTKEELKDYLNLEDYYLYHADEFIDCEKIYGRLCKENPDNNVHVYIDKEYQGCTERMKDMFIYRNGAIYKTYICSYDRHFDSYQVATDHYSSEVNARGFKEFKEQVIAAVDKHPEFFQSNMRDIIYNTLRFYRNGIVKLF